VGTEATSRAAPDGESSFVGPMMALFLALAALGGAIALIVVGFMYGQSGPIELVMLGVGAVTIALVAVGLRLLSRRDRRQWPDRKR